MPDTPAKPEPPAPPRPPFIPPGQPPGPVAVAAPPGPRPPQQDPFANRLSPVNPALRSPFQLGPPSPTMWERAWPRLNPAASTTALGGALGAAIVAAVALPVDRPGLGWSIAGLGLLAPLAILLARKPGASAGARIEGVLWCAAAMGLLSVGFFRAAGWLFALCAFTAFGATAMAVGRHGRVPAILHAPFTLVLAVFRAAPWAGAGLSRPARRATTAVQADNGLRLLGSIGIGVALLIVFGALFASADAGFARLVAAVTPTLDAGTVVRWVVVGLVAAGLALGGAFLVANPSEIGDGEPRVRHVRRIEWLVPVGALLLLFMVFVGVQLTVFFGDRDYVMRTVGLTFAEYARKGFWQLLVITLLTLCVMGVTARKALPQDKGLLRGVLGLLALCSLVVVGSALWRMDVYEQAYGFTRLRVFVSAVELWLGGLFVLVLLAGAVPARRWLGRAGVALWVAVLLGLAVLNPDRFIAAHNVERVDRNNADVWYLHSLSADAVPELDRLPAGARECALSGIAADLAANPDDWRGWNLARSHARQMVPGPLDAGKYPCYRRY
ncbi:DUF4173 domain-containing protein [Dactylosporangium matsuzakiense]|uniref:DUF4173 domain-containing protein n=1 Tax=Dactylosporangium matsuzakiense TaxID=53360 RepID=A0A9W6KLX2_9ACTN|nr:hypothetical protein GCM10017581_053640 [Dactylosporangium matsuzakiense]